MSKEIKTDVETVLENGVAKEFKRFVRDYGKEHISIDRFNDIFKAIEVLEEGFNLK